MSIFFLHFTTSFNRILIFHAPTFLYFTMTSSGKPIVILLCCLFCYLNEKCYILSGSVLNTLSALSQSAHESVCPSNCLSVPTSNRKFHYCNMANYASSSPGDANYVRQLTSNFELWVEILCVPTCFHMSIPISCLSPGKEIAYNFVNISLVVIDTSMERSSRVLQHGNPNILFPSKKKGLNGILTS